MQFYQVPHDRQSQPQTAMLSRTTAFGLPETIKDVRQKLCSDSQAGIADLDDDAGLHAFHRHLDASTTWRELDRVRQQIPGNLLQSIGITRDLARIGIEYQ